MTVIASEIERFDRLSTTWWNSAGPMRPLLVVNALRLGEPQAALRDDERFDVVLALEVVEHVSNVRAFVATAARSVAPGGMLFASTIDRAWKSFLFAIVGAEYVFRVLPRGTHDWQRFVRPAELSAAAGRAGLVRTDLRGMRYLPVVHRASWTRDTKVNYIAAFAHPA